MNNADLDIFLLNNVAEYCGFNFIVKLEAGLRYYLGLLKCNISELAIFYINQLIPIRNS